MRQKVIDSLAGYTNLNALAQVALHTVFGVNKKMHLTFKTNPSWGKGDDDGDTKPDSAYSVGADFYATIRLNPWMLKHSTQEYIASTIIHEAIHAYIDFKNYEYLTEAIDSTAFKALFPTHWPPKVLYTANNLYYYALGNNPQHQAIAGNLVGLMTNALGNLYLNPTIAGHTRDSIYQALSWGGLQETNVWKTRTDTAFIRAMNTMARDTSVRASFILTSAPGTTYSYDSHNLNMKKGCN